jgi:hypothetical protein
LQFLERRIAAGSSRILSKDEIATGYTSDSKVRKCIEHCCCSMLLRMLLLRNQSVINFALK